MPAKRKFKLDQFLEIISNKSMSTGIIARKVKCHISTALRYLRELKAAKKVIEQRISNTIILWKLKEKRILLVDVDSTITNLALAKISAYHKMKGDHVKLVKIKLKRRKDGTLKECIKVDLHDKPDKVYISVIFKKNKQAVDEFVSKYPNLDIDIGGSGYDLKKELPPEIEYLKPDYDLYPENDYSLGYSSRGCFRRCGFCIIREKEGMFRRTQHPSKWINPAYKKIVFLDNNILTSRKYFMSITDWCIEKGLRVWFTQGIDIRRVNDVVARRLLEMKHFKMITFAWDNLADEQAVRARIETLQSAGFTKNKLRAMVQFYVYVDSSSEEEYQSGLYRARELKKMNCNAFIMFNIDNKRSQGIINLQRWANRKMLFWKMDISEYKRGKRATC